MRKRMTQRPVAFFLLTCVYLTTVSCFAPSSQKQNHLRVRPYYLISGFVWQLASPPSHPLFQQALQGNGESFGGESVTSKQQQFTSQDPQETKVLLAELNEDLAALSALRPNRPAADPSTPTAIVSAGSSYTRIWTHGTWQIHSDPPHKRYFRHVLKWPKSTTARRILPCVVWASTWSMMVSWLATNWQFNLFQSALEIVGSRSAVSVLSAPLALLLTLRANASMARLLEARLKWGGLVLHARGLASILGAYVFPSNPKGAVLAVRYVCMLGWMLKAQVRGEPEESQLEILQTMLGGRKSLAAEHEWLKAQSKRTVSITSRIRQIYAHSFSSIATTNNDIKEAARIDHPATQLIVEERIRELEAVVGACERLFGSPIPPTYTRHLSRVMSLWLLLLPLSLVSSGLSTLSVAFATTVASYVFLGLDEVGMEIENVFQLMPLQQLAAATQNDCQNQFLATSGVDAPDFSF